MNEISISREGVEDEEPPSSAWVEAIVAQTLKSAKIAEACEVSVLITQDERMRELNKEYRGQDKTTDVLSFAMEETEIVLPPGSMRVLGDVVISLPQIRRQAIENQVSFSRECAWALCHGCLHLIAYDHQSDEQENEMRGLESEILAQFDEDFFAW